MPDPVIDPTSAQDVFKSVQTFETSTPKPATPPPSPPQSDASPAAPAKPDAGASTTVEIDKPDAMKPDAAKKGALDKLGQVKKPEVKAPEQKPNGTQTQTPESQPDLGKANVLREAYEKQKADMAALRAELEKARPDLEKLTELRAELDGSREELARLKAMNLSDDERKELVTHRQQNALQALRESPDFRKEYVTPILAQTAKIDNAAKLANLSAEATMALKDAMDKPDEFERDTEIERILQDADLAPNVYNRLFNGLTAVGRELQEKLYPALQAKEREAWDIQQSARQRDRQQAEQQTQASKQAYAKEQEFVYNALTQQALAEIVKDTDLAIEGTTMMDAMKGADIDDDPRERATQAALAAAGPFLIMKINKLLQQVHDLETANKIRNGSTPSRSDAVQKGADTGEKKLTAQEVFQAGTMPSFGV
jgi:hypothetical protein